MGSLTIEVPDVVARRLEALGSISGKKVAELALEGVEAFAGSHASRRALVKAWRKTAAVAATSYSLADLGWLEGYSGQAIDEILAFEGTEGIDRLLFALEDAIQEKIKASGPSKMTGVERMVLSLMALSREVNNGGYGQFFRNPFRRFRSGHRQRFGQDWLRGDRRHYAASLGFTGAAEIRRGGNRGRHGDREREAGSCAQPLRYIVLRERRTFPAAVCLRQSAPNRNSELALTACSSGPRTPETFAWACPAQSNGGSAPRTFRWRPPRSGPWTPPAFGYAWRDCRSARRWRVSW